MAWTRGQIIGGGSSATVSIATLNGSGEPFAVKSAELSRSVSLRNEQAILSTLKCPQIVAYKECDITNEHSAGMYNLFLEYAHQGTLIDTIRQAGGRLDEAAIRRYTRQILLGVNYLHSNGIVHCDIKGHNVLVTSDGAKIADFGCARRLEVKSGNNTCAPPVIAGTLAFMAPEVARGEYQGFSADVWALGCTIVEMATGQAPWVNNVKDPLFAVYQIGFSGKAPEIPSSMSKQGKDFLSKCLKQDPTERWSARQLLEHDFMTEEEAIDSNSVNTPTSVLNSNQDWWKSSTGSSETTIWDSTHQISADSAVERIRKLAESSEGPMPRFCNWAEEEDDGWMTARSFVFLDGSTNMNNNIVTSGIIRDCSSNDISNDGGSRSCSDGDDFCCKHKLLLVPYACECTRDVLYVTYLILLGVKMISV